MTAHRVVIREAEDGDLEGVVSVLAAANAEFQKVVPRSFYDAYLANVLDVQSRRHDSQLLVAEDGETVRILGAITLYPDASREGWGWPPRWAGIRAVAVAPSARRRGIGRGLATACLERASALGAPTVCLHTAPFMEAAIRTYESVGFRRAPEFDGDAGEMVNARGMESRIPALAYRLDLDRWSGLS